MLTDFIDFEGFSFLRCTGGKSYFLRAFLKSVILVEKCRNIKLCEDIYRLTVFQNHNMTSEGHP
jgi:hypothetical protein